MAGYVVPLERETMDNSNFRKVLFTGPNSQLVVMSLEPGEDIGMEIHEDHDQFIRIEFGECRILLDGQEHHGVDGTGIVIPAGTEHNIINSSDEKELKLYTIYSPPEHPDGRIDKIKPEEGD